MIRHLSFPVNVHPVLPPSSPIQPNPNQRFITQRIYSRENLDHRKGLTGDQTESPSTTAGGGREHIKVPVYGKVRDGAFTYTSSSLFFFVLYRLD